MRQARGRRRGLTLIEMMTAIGVIGIVLALILPAIAAARDNSRRSRCMNNLKQLGLGMYNYHSSKATLPIGRMGRYGPGYPSVGDPTGANNRRTWAFSLLPYFEASPLYNQINFNHSFKHVANLTACTVTVMVYTCPADNGAKLVDPGLPSARVKGNYVVNWGNTHYDQATASDPFNGPLGAATFGGAPFGLDVAIPFSAITDGLANTLLMSEVVSPDAKAGVSDRRGDLYNDDPNATMFMAYSPPNSTTPDQMPMIKGSPDCVYPWGSNPPCNTSSPAFNAARSQHAGGVYVLMADGAVKFVKDSVALPVWRDISTSQGAESGQANPY
jgi:prepilin-type N-terminal cleavage/methylation domain-containing protein